MADLCFNVAPKESISALYLFDSGYVSQGLTGTWRPFNQADRSSGGGGGGAGDASAANQTIQISYENAISGFLGPQSSGIMVKTVQSTGYSASPIKNTTGLSLNANTNRKLLYCQNLGTNPLYINFTGNFTSNFYHTVLKGGSATGVGDAGALTADNIFGVIYISGVNPYYSLWETY